MKKKDIRELTTKSESELSVMLKKLRSEMVKLLLERDSGKLKNISLVGNKRKEIARILTIIRKNQLAKI